MNGEGYPRVDALIELHAGLARNLIRMMTAEAVAEIGKRHKYRYRLESTWGVKVPGLLHVSAAV